MATDDTQTPETPETPSEDQAAPDAHPDDRPGETLDSVRAERDALKQAREAASRLAEKFRKENNELRRSQAKSAPAPDLEEVQRERDELRRQVDQERAARVKDRNDLAISQVASKYVDPDFLDYAVDRLDRSLLEVDDETGVILAGIPQAVHKLIKDKPKLALPRKPDPGTGTTRNPGGGGGKAADPVAAILNQKTSLGT